MLELRIVKTLETVLASFTRCELFLARFYNARSREFQYFMMKNLWRFPVYKASLIMQELHIIKTLETVLARYNNDVMPDLFGHRLSVQQKGLF